jgi:hypothetical protein
MLLELHALELLCVDYDEQVGVLNFVLTIQTNKASFLATALPDS